MAKKILIIFLYIINIFFVAFFLYAGASELFGDFPYWGYEQWPWYYENKIIYSLYSGSILFIAILSLGLSFIYKNVQKLRFAFLLVYPTIILIEILMCFFTM